MNKVFIGGSRRTTQLNRQIREKLDDLMDEGFSILVGDANGADKALQRYLHHRHYRDVEVFFSEGVCRNNVGDWPRRSVPAGTQKRDAQFYSAKDRAMAREASSGLMIWDGKSVGTLLNLYRLLRLNKKAVFYSVPETSMVEFSDLSEWEEFLGSRDIGLQKKVDGRRRLESSPEYTQVQMPFMD